MQFPTIKSCQQFWPIQCCLCVKYALSPLSAILRAITANVILFPSDSTCFYYSSQVYYRHQNWSLVEECVLWWLIMKIIIFTTDTECFSLRIYCFLKCIGIEKLSLTFDEYSCIKVMYSWHLYCWYCLSYYLHIMNCLIIWIYYSAVTIIVMFWKEIK